MREDIVRGDACLKETLGITPKGFRAPHFGTYQKPRDLRFLHAVLRELGYSFSSSTIPLYAFRYGPVFDRFGIRELPVCGRASAPLLVLDSWSHFAAPARDLQPDDFEREGRALAARFAALGAGIINFYADPSHIHASEIFFATIARWREVAEPVTYAELLDRIP